MKHENDVWPPPPALPEPMAEADDDDWLTANDFVREVTWRDYAVTALIVVWLLLACAAIAFHHRLPAGATKSKLETPDVKVPFK